MDELSQSDLAWAAGFIDADGTITIRRNVRKAKPENGRPSDHIQHQALVQLGQRDYPEQRKGVEKLHAMFGGYLSHYQPLKPQFQRMVTWGVASQKAIQCLEKIYPHLVVKKLNAEIVMEFHRNKIYFQGGPNTVTPEERKRREDCWNRIRELNLKGVVRL